MLAALVCLLAWALGSLNMFHPHRVVVLVAVSVGVGVGVAVVLELRLAAAALAFLLRLLLWRWRGLATAASTLGLLLLLLLLLAAAALAPAPRRLLAQCGGRCRASGVLRRGPRGGGCARRDLGRLAARWTGIWLLGWSGQSRRCPGVRRGRNCLLSVLGATSRGRDVLVAAKGVKSQRSP